MTEREEMFCSGYGLPLDDPVPRKRGRIEEEEDINLEIKSSHRRQGKRYEQDIDQRPHKRHIPNSFYGSQAARLGIIPASTGSTLHRLAHLGRKSVRVGVGVSKRVPSIVCKDVSGYVRDVHRAGVVRSVFETMEIPGEVLSLDAWLEGVDRRTRQVGVGGEEAKKILGGDGRDSAESTGNGLDSESEDSDTALWPGSVSVPIYRPSERPPASSILAKDLIPARLPSTVKHTSLNSACNARTRHATTVDAAAQAPQPPRYQTQPPLGHQTRTSYQWKQKVDSQSPSEIVISAMLKRPQEGRGRESILTPFSRAELKASRSRSSKRDAISDFPLASQSERVSSQNDLRSSVLRKTASTLPPDSVSPSLQPSQPSQPAPRFITCPLCELDDPLSSIFCTTCLTPFPPSPAPRFRSKIIVNVEKQADIYTHSPDGKEAILISFQKLQRGLLSPSDDDDDYEYDDDEEYLCTGSAGPPGTLAENSSRAPMSSAKPYFSDIQEETLATRKALSMDRSVETERAWMWRLARLRCDAKEENEEGPPFPLNVPGYEDLRDWEVSRLEADVEVLDGWLASMKDATDTLHPEGDDQDPRADLSAAEKREADRNERLKEIQQREADRQYVEHVAELQRQALDKGFEFPEGVPGWDEVDPIKQQRIMWAVYTNQVNRMSEKVRSKLSIVRSRDEQAKEAYHALLAAKFEGPKRTERVRQTAVLRYSILHAAGRWPDDVKDWDETPDEFKKWVAEVTQYLELQKEFESLTQSSSSQASDEED